MKTIHLALVAYLPKSISREATRVTRILSRKFHTYTSAREWDPHLTVGSSLHAPQNSLDEVVRDFRVLAKSLKKAPVKVRGIGFMIDFDPRLAGCPYVIFMRVLSTSKLKRLFQTLESYKKFRKPGYQIKAYRPYITLAYDDLTKSKFEKAWAFLQEMNYNPRFDFFVDNVSLVAFSKTRHKWVSARRFPLR